MNSPLIIGHRGASAVAPENTMAAFHEAIAAGADGIEFDVRLTRDRVPVVIHDSTLHRTAGLPKRIADLTWSEIESVDVGSWFARKKNLPPGSFANETVPSLRELFTLFQSNNLTLCLEMKCDSVEEYTPLAEACRQVIAEYGFKDRVIVECFKIAALAIVKQLDAKIITAALFEPSFSTPSVLSDKNVITRATAVGASYLALHYRLAREGLVEKAKLAGLKVALWTVDDPTWIERARAMGIEALITNDPAAMLAHR
ncbi:MAG TPA: glycerophosphodiester phosphodiesterase family protein [Pyrinomonadaceae bacterium]|nr:glycerophosphodiester phosphodiesterase family protein [Pyrinomonadaceae bacterium]